MVLLEQQKRVKDTPTKKFEILKTYRNVADIKKAFESYEIHDFVIRYPWEEVKQEWESGDEYYKDKYSTLQELRRHWEKYYYSK